MSDAANRAAPSPGAAAKIRIRLTVNGSSRQAEVDPRTPLVHLLRDEFGLTGTRFGCLTGHCGACTVLLGGRAVKSCTVLAASADGDDVLTIEGLAADGQLHVIQQAFWDRYGFQCGFCTPGMIMTALELLADHPQPTEEEIRAGISGNLCRCTGYQGIVRAIQAAAEDLSGGGTPG
jgi:carbon-monoxide dehydrogenase small subunit